MRPFERIAYRVFGRLAKSGLDNNSHLKLAVMRAHIRLRPEAYLAAAYLASLLTFVAIALPVLLLAVLQAARSVSVPTRVYLFLAPAPVVVALIVYLLLLVLPHLRSIGRAREIDAKLPYAINYLSTMAAAGATPAVLFAGLARQPIYGAVAQEASWITRDIQILGLDIMAALSHASERCPSARLQDLLQGIITTLSSGSDLKSYLNNKSDQFLLENRQDQRRFLDSLGVLAESFVTVVVAAPLFLIIILSVFTSFGGSVADTLLLGYALVFLLIPLSQLGFGWAIASMTPEA